jgi:soluble lytic murein transglycosylase-like protein
MVIVSIEGPVGRAAGSQRGGTSTTSAPAPPSQSLEVRILDLTAVQRLFRAIARKRPAMTEGERAAAWTDLALMLEAVAGGSSLPPLSFDDLQRASTGDTAPLIRVSGGVAMRDQTAYQMLAVGYSAREAADVVGGRITREALDMARRMIAAGRGRDAAAEYLDRQYARMAWRPPAPTPVPRPEQRGRTSPFDPLIAHYAQLHGVDLALVRAIIAAESAFNPLALSRAGAIGLMQLMPMTARELGVNPFVPEQNIEGGVRYFAELLGKFGAVELALIAYNAGPGFAERYARGQAALYGETREYVRQVLTRLRGQGPL